MLVHFSGTHGPGPDPVKRARLETVYASPALGANGEINRPLPVQFTRVERFRSYPDRRVDGIMTALPVAKRGDPLFADGISAESGRNICFGETPDSLHITPIDGGSFAHASWAKKFAEIVQIKRSCPFVGVCNSMTGRSGFSNEPIGDMAIEGIVKFIALIRCRVYAGQPVIFAPYASSMLARDKTGTVAGQAGRLIAQMIIAGWDAFFPTTSEFVTNFNMFSVSGFAVNSCMDGYTIGSAYILK